MPIDRELARQRLERMLAERLKPDRETLSQRVRMSNEESDTPSLMLQINVAAGAANAAATERDIQWALKRLEQGTYETCFDCEEPIAPSRLEAVPATRICVNCQEIFDQRNARDRRGLRNVRPPTHPRPVSKNLVPAWES